METIKSYNPHKALIVYQSDNDYYCEVHTNLSPKEQQPNWSEAQLLTERIAKELSKELATQKTQKLSNELIPKSIVHIHANNPLQSMIWVKPSCITPLFFSKNLFQNNYQKYRIPNLLFVIKNRRLNVYATKTTNISIDTKLYQAPFFNVTSQGGICLGSARKLITPEFDSLQEIISAYEKAFLNSEFTEVHSACFKQELKRFWKNHHSHERFPNHLLIRSPFTIKQLLND